MDEFLNNKKLKIAITGASGFVGRRLVSKLINRGCLVRAVVRNKTFNNLKDNNLREILIEDISDKKKLIYAFSNVDVVVHLLGNTHSSTDLYEDYYDVNVLGTKHVINAASKNKVNKIIMLSSIKVNGEGFKDTGFTYKEESDEFPLDNYGKTKLMAEKLFSKYLVNKSTEYIIIRSPLVYGPGVKGNLKRLMEIIYKGLPVLLPYKENKRSIISIDNLCNAIIQSIFFKSINANLFLVSDDMLVSTKRLVEEISNAMSRKPKYIFIPYIFLKPIFFILGKSSFLNKISYSLEIDNSKIKRTIGWKDNNNFREDIINMVARFLKD